MGQKGRVARMGQLQDVRSMRSSTTFRRHAGEQRPSKRQRIAVSHDPSEGDIDDAGSDSDGNKWHLGLDNEDEDSDLDSDEAMGESDQERFEGFGFRGSRKTQPSSKPKPYSSASSMKKVTGINLLENDPGATDLEQKQPDDLGNNSVKRFASIDVEDGNGGFALQTQESRAKLERYGPSNSLGKGDYPPEDDDTEDAWEHELDDSGSEPLSSADKPGGHAESHARLRTFVEGIAEPRYALQQPKEKVQYLNLPDQPSAYGLQSSTKLTVADLLPTIKDPRLRQSLKALQSSEGTGDRTYLGGIPGKLEPPLAKSQQDRLDRTAAYDKSKQTLQRWVATVTQNRRAEHISFPQSNGEAESLLGSKELMLLSQSGHATSLESTIQSILQESGLESTRDSELQVQAYEELKEKRIPLAEVQARRAELRKARDLLFREEVKARRIRKIKSKAYRRVHRKERDKVTQEERAALAAAGVVDSDGERERHDRRRVEERMGAKHRENRWANGVKSTGRAAWDEDARSGVADLARRDEELRRRIEAKAVAGSDGSDIEGSTSDSDDSTNAGSDGATLRKMEDELTMLDHDDVQQTGSKLSSMAFMRKAEESRKRANDTELQQGRRTLGVTYDDGTDDEVHEDKGRLKFGLQRNPSPPARLHHADSRDDKYNGLDEDLSDGLNVHAGHSHERHSRKVDTKSRQGPLTCTATKIPPPLSGNPWLSGSKNNKASNKSKHDTFIVNTSASTVLDVPKESRRPEAQQHLHKKADRLLESTLTTPSRLEEATLDTETQPPDIESRNAELVRMAFAGDNVFDDFAKEKRSAIEDEGDQVVDNTLPGWGNWTGAGISQRERGRAQGRFVTTVKGVQADKRKDARLERVIINEKRVKKNAKYLATELPHPFESRQQYERSLRLPLGPEWTTKSTFQDAIKPRVLMKQGIIRPMARPTV